MVKSFPFLLDKPTGEALFAGDGANCKSSAPAGQASKGALGFVLNLNDLRGKARVSTVWNDKAVDLRFDADSLTSSSKNGSSTMRLAGFVGFTLASKGFFLIPNTGVSIYVPRAIIDPSDSYSLLIELLASTITPNGSKVADNK